MSTLRRLLVDEHRLVRRERILRMQLQQRVTMMAAFFVTAASSVIVAIVHQMTLTVFLSHEAVLLLPFVSMILAVAGMRAVQHDSVIKELESYDTQVLLPSVRRPSGMPPTWSEHMSGRSLKLWKIRFPILGGILDAMLILFCGLVFLVMTGLVVFLTATRAGQVAPLYDGASLLAAAIFCVALGYLVAALTEPRAVESGARDCDVERTALRGALPEAGSVTDIPRSRDGVSEIPRVIDPLSDVAPTKPDEAPTAGGGPGTAPSSVGECPNPTFGMCVAMGVRWFSRKLRIAAVRAESRHQGKAKSRGSSPGSDT